ncbi:MAG: HAD family hydrolase [Candidatus Hodarchaeales archaeon]|jgi:FMN phosphatase YigB (HAD superfamily)
MLPRIVLFDLIGTLTNPWRQLSPEEKLELIGALQEEGLRISPQEFDAALNFSLYINCPRNRFSTSRKLILDVVRLLGESTSKKTLEILDKELRRRIPVLKPYIKEILGELRAYGIMPVVATDLPAFLTNNLRDELEGYIDKWFSSNDIGVSKGHPDFFLRIFEKLRIDEPGSVLVVSSDELLDFRILKAVGTQLLYIGEKEQIPSLRSIEELPTFLKAQINM